MKLDQVDIKILEILEENSRLSYREIAKKVDVTTPTISTKIETLKKIGLIQGFITKISAEHLNEVTVLLNIECKPSDIKKIIEKLGGKDEVRELFVVDGAQIHCKLTVLDQVSLNRFLEELEKIEEIRNYEYKTVTKTIKELCRAVLFDGLNVTIDCFYCKKPMIGIPVKLKLDGKDHYLCCNTCAKEYEKKYERIKAGI